MSLLLCKLSSGRVVFFAFLLIGYLFIPLTESKADESTPSTVVFMGSDFKQEASYGNVGVINALNGDVFADGFLIRAIAGFGGYTYTSASAGGKVNSALYQDNIGVGYQFFTSELRFSIFNSVAYEDQHHSPADPSNRVRGERLGDLTTGEVETQWNAPIYFNGIASYNTAFNSYWVRGRAGLYLSQGLAVGPQIIAMGNIGFEQWRYGGFISGVPLPALPLHPTANLSAGWAVTPCVSGQVCGAGGGGRNAAYLSLGLSFAF